MGMLDFNSTASTMIPRGRGPVSVVAARWRLNRDAARCVLGTGVGMFCRQPGAEAARLARGLRRGISLLAAVGPRLLTRFPAGEGQPEDAAMHRQPLFAETSGVVGQFVALTDVLDPRRDLGVAATGHVRIQMVFDLIAEVAAD